MIPPSSTLCAISSYKYNSQDWDDGISIWQANRVPAHRRSVRVHEKHNYIKPGNYKDDQLFLCDIR